MFRFLKYWCSQILRTRDFVLKQFETLQSQYAHHSFFSPPSPGPVVTGATVPAHRAVLVARCEVMAAMFNGNFIESNIFLVPVYGISKDTFLSFLEYLYTDSCCPGKHICFLKYACLFRLHVLLVSTCL